MQVSFACSNSFQKKFWGYLPPCPPQGGGWFAASCGTLRQLYVNLDISKTIENFGILIDICEFRIKKSKILYGGTNFVGPPLHPPGLGGVGPPEGNFGTTGPILMKFGENHLREVGNRFPPSKKLKKIFIYILYIYILYIYVKIEILSDLHQNWYEYSLGHL